MKSINLLLVSVACVILSGCSGFARSVAESANEWELDKYINRSYDEVIYENPRIGKLMGRESINDNYIVMKHLGEYGSSSSSMADGIYGKKTTHGRIVYFKVNSQSKVVEDWAFEIVEMGSGSCWFGICEGTDKKVLPIQEMDKLVKTSEGKSFKSWFN